jgi:hypothetical protein
VEITIDFCLYSLNKLVNVNLHEKRNQSSSLYMNLINATVAQKKEDGGITKVTFKKVTNA